MQILLTKDSEQSAGIVPEESSFPERKKTREQVIRSRFDEPDTELNKIGQAFSDSEKTGMPLRMAYEGQKTIKQYGASGSWSDDSWWQVIKKSVQSVPEHMKLGIAGVVKAYEESPDKENFDKLDKKLISAMPVEYRAKLKEHIFKSTIDPDELSLDAQRRLSALQPVVKQGSLKYYAASATESVLTNLAYLLPSLATKNPSFALAAMGFQAGGEAYLQQREGGMTAETAKLSALGYGLSEVLTEFIPVGVYLKPSKSFVKKLITAQLTEIPTEAINEVAQIAIDKVTISPDMTLYEAVNRVMETVIVTAISTPALAGVSHIVTGDIGKKLAEPLKGEAGALFPESPEQGKSKFNPEKHSLSDFIRIKGGINEQEGGLTGEAERLKEMGKKGPGLVKKEGISFDQMREAAVEQGFISEETTLSEFIDIVERDLQAQESESPLERIWSSQKDINAEIESQFKKEYGAEIEEDVKKVNEAIKRKELPGVLKKKITTLKAKLDKEVFAKEFGKTAAIEEFKNKLEADIKELEFIKEYETEEQKAKFNEKIDKLKIDIAGLETRVKEVRESERFKAQERISKIKTEKDIMNRRRQKIRSIRDTFMLTDAQLRKINKKDLRLMSNFEFKKYTEDIYQMVIELQEQSQAKAELIDLINRQEFKSYENLISVYGLPPINKMSTAQLREFADTLSQYQTGDVFLSPARLENIDRTDLEGARTWREVKERLAEKAGVPVDQVESINMSEIAKYMGDASLTEKGPFFKVIVSMMTAQMLKAKAKSLALEKEMIPYVRKSNKSRNLSVKEWLVPQDKDLQAYMEAEPNQKESLAKGLTSEQLEYANFMQTYLRKAYEQMLQDKVINGSRFTDNNYYAHIRRGFIETIADGNIKEAFKNLLKHEVEDSMRFGIIDNTGQILAYEKFFSHILYRTGDMVPTSNVTRSFKTYMDSYFKKQALDEIIVLIDMYAQAVTPQLKTRKGLPYDPRIKSFINEWINNKKGRRASFQRFIPQGGKIDILLRGGKALTTMLHLGFNLPVQLAAPAGEQSATLINIGAQRYVLGLKRYGTKQGNSIAKKYENFVGRSLWEEISLPDKEASERLHDALFGLFSLSYQKANKLHLLSALTEQEFNSGEVSPERLAEIQIEMARYRHVSGMESIAGATSLGKAVTQYKSWSLPILGRTARNLMNIAKGFKQGNFKVLNEERSWEVYRGILTSVTLLTIYSSIDEDDDKSFLATIKRKLMRESLTFAQGLSPTQWARTPVLMAFIDKLAQNIMMFVSMEEYKTKEGLKGAAALKRQLTPIAVKQISGAFSSENNPRESRMKRIKNKSRKTGSKSERMKRIKNKQNKGR